MRIFLNINGSIKSTMSGDLNAIQLNTPEDAVYVDDVSCNDVSDYWDFDLFQFISVGDRPSNNHVFNYDLKQWIDLQSLSQFKSLRWIKLKQDRDALEFGGFEFNGLIYDSDQISQGRILGAMLSGVDQVWTTQNNTVVALSASQIQLMCLALQQHVADAHARGRTARIALDAASSIEEVNSIVI